MSDPRTHRVLGVPIRQVRYITAIVAALVAGIHLLHPSLGLPRLIEHVRIGTLLDPRPLVFTVAGVAIVLGMVLVGRDRLVRAVYAGGIALMATFLLGYVVWHTALDHGAFWPHIDAHGHDTGLLEVVRVHLADDAVAAMSKAYELVALALLVVLVRYDPRAAPRDGGD